MQNRALTAVLLAILAQRLNAQGTVSYRIAYTGAAGTQLEPVEVGYLLITTSCLCHCRLFASVLIQRPRANTQGNNVVDRTHRVYMPLCASTEALLALRIRILLLRRKETRLQLCRKISQACVAIPFRHTSGGMVGRVLLIAHAHRHCST